MDYVPSLFIQMRQQITTKYTTIENPLFLYGKKGKHGNFITIRFLKRRQSESDRAKSKTKKRDNLCIKIKMEVLREDS